MKLVRFKQGEMQAYGVLENKKIQPVTGDFQAIARGEFARTGKFCSLMDVSLLAPCLPSKVICLGLNYRGHAAEMNLELPREPIIFMKPSTAVIGSGQDIIHPPQSRRVDYEAELGVVMGARARKVSPEEALDYVLGYTCANDVTARDLQPKDGQWAYAKGFDTFAPLGPWIETSVPNPDNLQLKGYLNGELVQSTSTTDHIFPVARLLSYISACMTLLPGDVIMTGTPPGIGPMQAGDVFEIDIEGIGKLGNRLVKEDS